MVRRRRALPAFLVEAARLEAPVDPLYWYRAAVAADRSTHESDLRRLARRPRRRPWTVARRADLSALRSAYAAWLAELGYDPSERVARLRLERVRLYSPADLRLFESLPGGGLEDGFVSSIGNDVYVADHTDDAVVLNVAAHEFAHAIAGKRYVVRGVRDDAGTQDLLALRLWGYGVLPITEDARADEPPFSFLNEAMVELAKVDAARWHAARPDPPMSPRTRSTCSCSRPCCAPRRGACPRRVPPGPSVASGSTSPGGSSRPTSGPCGCSTRPSARGRSAS